MSAFCSQRGDGEVMADNPPYMNAYGLIPKIMTKLKEAQRPDRFSQDFLSTKLGFPGGSAKAFIPFAKRIGLLKPDGTPTDLYTKFRNDAHSGQAIAQAMRNGYETLYERNEYAHELSDEKLLGLVVEATGLEKNATIVRSVQNSFIALKKLANFEKSALTEPEPETPQRIDPSPSNVPPHTVTQGLGLSYTINLNLPETTNVAVFNAIFKSLKEHLL